MPKFHTQWVTSAGRAILEEAVEAPDAESVARSNVRAILDSKESGGGVSLKSIEEDLTVIIDVDHFVVVPEDRVKVVEYQEDAE